MCNAASERPGKADYSLVSLAAGMCRLSVRSASKVLSDVCAELIAGQFAASYDRV